MQATKQAQSELRKAIRLAIVSSTFVAISSPAFAESTSDSLDLEEIVVTGTSLPLAKIKTSSSISTVDEAALELAAPTSAADALRSIPGIHSEASSGEGNANVSVRGIPISAGGTRYVAMQEDGLQLLLNGDYAFVTPDEFLRVDNSLDHIEAVRGGAAAVQAANSPGALINFITKDGSKEGGSVGLTSGLDYQQVRWDWDYGQHISDKTRFFVGGFYRNGQGIRNGSLPVEDGGQVKANITHDLDDNGSFIRFNFKRLQDRSRLGMAAGGTRLSNTSPTKANPATVEEDPVSDPRYSSFNSPYFPTIVGRDVANNLTYHDANGGLVSNETAVGVQVHLSLGHDWTLDESFRKTSRSGQFNVGIATGGQSSFDARPGSTIASGGPNAGAAYTGKVTPMVVFDTTINDFGNVVNALKFSKKIFVGSGATITPIFGWDYFHQKTEITFYQPWYLTTADGDQPRLINGSFDFGGSTGVLTTDADGTLPLASQWGGTYRNLDYVQQSPYFNLAVEAGNLNLDGGVRYDGQKVSGVLKSATGVPGDAYSPGTFDAASSKVNYRVKNTSFTLGANYAITNDLAVFGRYSSGAALNTVDRATGPVDGSAPVAKNEVKQADLGLKFRTGGFSAFVTLFDARTKEGNYSLTTQETTNTSYKTTGVELELGYATDVGFQINGSVTALNPKIVNSNGAGTDGNRPKRMAKLQYQLQPSYSIGVFKVGLSVIGQDKAFADNGNTIILPGFTTIGLFAGVNLSDKADISVSANNLGNTLAFTEYDGGATGGPGGRALDGRSIKAAFKYKF